MDNVAAPAKVRRILVVDDEEGITTALRRSLRAEGYQIETCNDPVKALSLLERARFDIIISDHLMPGMTGLELMRAVRERHPDMLRLMLSGQPDTDMLIKAINQGEVFRFVTKPWDDRELKGTLACALKQLDAARESRRVEAVVTRWQWSF